MPEELLATTPPTVQATSLAGSGPSLRPNRARRVLTARMVAPGWTRTRAPSSRTSIPVNPVRVSTRTESLSACPDSEVPPLRKVSGTPRRVQARITSATAAASRAVTTARGWSR